MENVMCVQFLAVTMQLLIVSVVKYPDKIAPKA